MRKKAKHLARSDSQVEADSLRKKAKRLARSESQVKADKSKQRARMRKLRMGRTAVELARRGKFHKTKCWQEPGKGYSFHKFQQNPETSALLWYGNNGSWRNREIKWLRAFIQVARKIQCEIKESTELREALDRLNGLYEKCIKDEVSLCQVVHDHITEKDWITIQDWQVEVKMNDLEMAALEWFATQSSTPLGGIAYDPPVDGGNCLFYALLKGLERVCPREMRQIEGVDEFRRELMECLDDEACASELVKDRTLHEWAKISWKSKFGTLSSGWEISDYTKLMRDSEPCNKCDDTSYCKCKWGGALEQFICAFSWGVNVAVQRTTEADPSVDNDCTAAGIMIDESYPTIHLAYDGSHYRLVRDKMEKPCPFDDEWARSLIGYTLRVPGWWWVNNTGDTNDYECRVKKLDYSEKEERYFVVQCYADGVDYPMAYVDVRKYAVETGSRRLPSEPIRHETDEAYVKLCKDASEKLKVDDPRDVFLQHAIERARQIIDSQLVTPEIQKEKADEFLRQQGRGVSWGDVAQYVNDAGDIEYQSIDAPMFTCASCGLRDLDPVGKLISEKSVRELKWAVLDPEDRSKFTKAMRTQTLSLPTSDKGDFRDFDIWKARSTWPARRENELSEDASVPDWMFDLDENKKPDRSKPKYFHLHPEFVVESEGSDGKKDYKVKLCPCCFYFDTYLDMFDSYLDTLDKEEERESDEENKPLKGPRMSIASGVDLGSPKRIGLTPLTPRERQIISKMRHYNCAVQIQSNTGPHREHTHYAIKGHSILFDHDSPRVVEELLNSGSINDSIDIQFVGPEGQYDHLARKALGSALVSARPFVVYQWLKALKQVNEYYVNDDELPPFEEVVNQINECNRALIKDAVMTSDEKVIKETIVAKDDVAQIRAISGQDVHREVNQPKDMEADEKSTETNETEEETDETGEESNADIPMKFSYCTRQNKTTHDMNSDDAHDYFVAAAKTLGIKVDEEEEAYSKAKEAKVAQSRRGDNPFNEFVGGDTGEKDEGLRKSFPDVFFLGRAYDTAKASLSTTQVLHLLLQFTSNAASCQPLLFYLFNQKQRHGTIKGMHAKYTSNEDSFQKFAKDYLSTSFQNKLKEAVMNPEGTVAKGVLKKIEPVLTGGGKQTIFGAVQQHDSGGKILAMKRRFACAPAFLTFAIDDVNHPTSLRLSIDSSNNTDYPAIVSGEAHEAMKHGFKYTGEGNVSIPASWTDRFKALVKNPVGAAYVYKTLVNDVLAILVGKKPAFGQNEQSRKTTEFTSWDQEGIGVIVGTTLAYIGVTETTGRGSLHFHVILWGGLSPELLEMVSDMPELCERVGAVLDSTFRAEMPRYAHMRDLVTKDLRQHGKCSKAFKDTTFPAAARSMQILPNPVDPEFEEFVYCNICGRNIHTHTFTCHKPPNGRHGCRMCKPSGLNNGTMAVELVLDKDEDTITLYAKEVSPAKQLVPENPKSDFSPLSSPDGRTIVWEIKRPRLAGLLALDSSSEDDSDEALNEIVSKLADAMDVQTDIEFSAAQIDQYTFTDDGDDLFHSMLKGLVVSGVLSGNEKSVRELRGELEAYLNDNMEEQFMGKTLGELARDSEGTNLKKLDMILLSEKYGVNVHLYSQDETTGKFQPIEAYRPSNGDDSTASIYLVSSSDDESYGLFEPKAYSIMRELKSLDFKQLHSLYSRVADKVEKRNGLVVEYNPLLSALLGCNTNLQLLGSKEQSKMALFYIGPYINKNGVKLTDALPLLKHAQDHALHYPSVADDAETPKRLVQFIMTKVLNKMNASMEISDTQAALALLGMGATVCSESFTYYDLKSALNFVLDEHLGVVESLDDIINRGDVRGDNEKDALDIDRMSLKDLKDELRGRGLTVSGNRDVLMGRLRTAIAEGAPKDSVATMKVVQLRAALNELKLSVDGRKSVLQNRLRAATNAANNNTSEESKECKKTEDDDSGKKW